MKKLISALLLIAPIAMLAGEPYLYQTNAFTLGTNRLQASVAYTNSTLTWVSCPIAGDLTFMPAHTVTNAAAVENLDWYFVVSPDDGATYNTSDFISYTNVLEPGNLRRRIVIP